MPLPYENATSVRYPVLAPDVEIPWPDDLDKREAAWGHDDNDPPLRLERLEATGCLSPPRPKRTGFIRGLLFVIPAIAILWVAVWVLL